MKAAKYAGLNVLELVPEPTAAAIAFGILSPEQSTYTSETILVFDFGGGTLDVSVLQRRGEHFDVKAVAGDTMLGGRDIDDCLLDYIIKREHLERVREQPRTIGRIRKAVVDAKILLSSADKGSVFVENIDGESDLDCWITREQFDNACRRVFDRITKPVQEALNISGIDKTRVDKILLIGGSSHIPKVKEVIERFFPGKRAFHGVDPSKAVVQGAAFYAGKLCGCPGLASFSVTNVSPLSLGMKTSGGVISVILKRGTPFGSSRSKPLATAHNYQTSNRISVYEGERPQAKHNHLLGHFTISGLPPRLAGEVKVDVTFALDHNGLLTVTAKAPDLPSESIQVSRDTRLHAEIDAMIVDAEQMRRQDAAEAALDREHARLKGLHENVKLYIDHERDHIRNVMAPNDIDSIYSEAKESLRKLRRENVKLGQRQSALTYYREKLRPVFFSGSNPPREYPKFLCSRGTHPRKPSEPTPVPLTHTL